MAQAPVSAGTGGGAAGGGTGVVPQCNAQAPSSEVSPAEEIARVAAMLQAVRGRPGSEKEVARLEARLAQLRDQQQAERPLQARLRSAIDKAAARKAAMDDVQSRITAAEAALEELRKEGAAAAEASAEADKGLLAVQEEWRVAEAGAAPACGAAGLRLGEAVTLLQKDIAALPPGACVGADMEAFSRVLLVWMAAKSAEGGAGSSLPTGKDAKAVCTGGGGLGTTPQNGGGGVSTTADTKQPLEGGDQAMSEGDGTPSSAGAADEGQEYAQEVEGREGRHRSPRRRGASAGAAA